MGIYIHDSCDEDVNDEASKNDHNYGNHDTDNDTVRLAATVMTNVTHMSRQSNDTGVIFFNQKKSDSHDQEKQ